MLVGVTPKSTLLLNWIREWFGLWMEQRLTVGTSLRIWENHFALEHVFRWRSALPSNRHSRMRAHKWASTSTAGSSVLLLLSDAKLLPSASSARHSLTKSHTFTIGPQREQKREKKRELPTLFVNIRPIVPRCATQKISFSLSLSPIHDHSSSFRLDPLLSSLALFNTSFEPPLLAFNLSIEILYSHKHTHIQSFNREHWKVRDEVEC